MKLLEINPRFIEDYIDELITLEDYAPISFIKYDKHNERAEFLRSKNLLNTMHEMDELVQQKCEHAEDSVKAYDSVLIEWLDCHPEFEGILTKESFIEYQNMKNNKDYIDFNDLLDFVELPSENMNEITNKFDGIDESLSIKDDSNIKYPNFNEMKKCFDKYPNTLLACYLSYLV